LLNLTARVRVAVIDVAGPRADLDCGRAEQPPYTAAWILVCQAGQSGAQPPPLSRASGIILTNFAREPELRRCVKQLGELDHPDYEVIVVDNRAANVPARPPGPFAAAAMTTAHAIKPPRVPKSLTVWHLLRRSLLLWSGIIAVSWAYPGAPAALAAAVTPFTVRDIRRAEFARV
jgi:hypothetical protein